MLMATKKITIRKLNLRKFKIPKMMIYRQIKLSKKVKVWLVAVVDVRMRMVAIDKASIILFEAES